MEETPKRPVPSDDATPARPVAGRRRFPIRSVGVALTGTVATAAVWVLLATWRPTTTFHLGPAVVAVAYPYLRRVVGGARRSRVTAAVDALVGGILATIVLVALDAAGRLQGPVLFGDGPVGEGLIVTAAAVVGAAVLGVLSADRPRAG